MLAVAGRRAAARATLASSYAITILALVKGFLFIPLYLRYFDLATYGGYLASANVVGMLGVLDIGISTAFHQRLAFAHGRGEQVLFARLAGAGMLVLSLTALAVSVIGWTISSHVPGWISATAESAPSLARVFRLTVIGSAALLLNQGILGVPAAWQRATIVASSRLGSQLIEMIVILAALTSGLGVVSLGIGALAGGLTGLAITLIASSRQWRLRKLPFPFPDHASFRWLLGVGVPTMMSRVAAQIASNLEVALAARYLGPSLAAVYGITERTFRLVQGFINPIVGSAFSGLAHLMGEKGPSALLSPLHELRGIYALVVSTVLPTLLIINRDFVTLWVGQEKFGGILLSSFLALNAVVGSQVGFLSYVAFATGQVKGAAYLTTIEAGIRVPLMIAGLHFFGLLGMPLSGVVGSSLLILVGYPVVLGKGLNIAAKVASSVCNGGVGASLLSLAVGGALAWCLPSTSKWPLLALKGGGSGLVFLAVTISSNSAARNQARSLASRLSRMFGRI